MELLPLALLRPEIAVLDETDSGLDIDALRTVAEGVDEFAGPNGRPHHHPLPAHPAHGETGLRPRDVRGPDRQGRRPELVGVLEEKGYGWIREEVGAGAAAWPLPRHGAGDRQSPSDADRAAGAGFPLAEVRAQFPALAREIHGQPVAYLDSGASSQRVGASIEAVDDYERRHHSNVHRGSHTLSAEATAAYEGAAPRSPTTSAPPIAAR